ncbi:MAG TPA: hypothetical protein VEC12_06440 [Bacteroidia bacterium]|nr:hypothetical protein [Bacteroidia bacterium]
MKQLILIILLFSLQATFACSCITLDTTYSEKTLESYDYIIKGTVEAVDSFVYVEVKDPGKSELIKVPYDSVKTKVDKNQLLFVELIIKVKISSYFKTDEKIKDVYVYVITGMGGGDCGFPFIPGRDYIIYGSNYKFDQPDNGLYISTNICTHTTSGILTELPKLSKVYKEKFIDPKE